MFLFGRVTKMLSIAGFALAVFAAGVALVSAGGLGGYSPYQSSQYSANGLGYGSLNQLYGNGGINTNSNSYTSPYGGVGTGSANGYLNGGGSLSLLGSANSDGGYNSRYGNYGGGYNHHRFNNYYPTSNYGGGLYGGNYGGFGQNNGYYGGGGYGNDVYGGGYGNGLYGGGGGGLYGNGGGYYGGGGIQPFYNNGGLFGGQTTLGQSSSNGLGLVTGQTPGGLLSGSTNNNALNSNGFQLGTSNSQGQLAGPGTLDVLSSTNANGNQLQKFGLGRR